MKEQFSLREIAAAVGGVPVGDDSSAVIGVASPENGRDGEIVCLWESKKIGRASCRERV